MRFSRRSRTTNIASAEHPASPIPRRQCRSPRTADPTARGGKQSRVRSRNSSQYSISGFSTHPKHGRATVQ